MCIMYRHYENAGASWVSFFPRVLGMRLKPHALCHATWQVPLSDLRLEDRIVVRAGEAVALALYPAKGLTFDSFAFNMNPTDF